MTAELTHEQAADEIEAVALGIATAEVAQGVAAHAARCAECAGELRSFYQVVTGLSTLIPETLLNRGHSAGIKSRLVAKATAGQEGTGARRPARVEPARAPEPRVAAVKSAQADDEVRPSERSGGGSRLPVWIAATSLLIAAAAVAGMLSARSERDAAQGGATDATTDFTEVAELERAVAERDTTIASLSGPGVRIISLFNREAREPLARMFWDRRSDRWTLFVYSLRQPREGKVFQLWLGTDNGRVSLGSFQPGADGTGTLSAHHALAIASLNTVSISEEDVGADAAAPTGPVVLAGALR